MAEKRELSVVGELRRISRSLRRDAKAQRAMKETERAIGRYGEWSGVLSGREIGLTWAAQRIDQRIRELVRQEQP